MRVTIGVVDSLGDRYRRTGWIRISRNMFRCGTDCGEQRMLVELAMPSVPSRDIRGTVDWPGDLETDVLVPIDVDQRGQYGPPVGSLNLELQFTPTGEESRRWLLSGIGEQDQSAGSLAVRPQLDITYSWPRLSGAFQNQGGVYFPDGFPGLPHAVVTVRIEADRPVNLSATISEYEDLGVCLQPGVAEPSISTSDFRTVHHFEINGLCTGSTYNVNVVAQDETGTTAQIFGVGPADGSTPIAFGTAYLRLEVRGEVVINPAAYGLGTSGSRLHVGMEDIYVQDSSGMGRYPVTNVEPTRSLLAEEADTGWNFDDPYGGVICANPDNNDGVLNSITLRAFPHQPGSIGDTALLTFRVWTWNAATRDVVWPGGYVYRCSSGPPTPTLNETYEFIPIEDLLAGVSFTSEDGLYTVTINGVPSS
jgi:hypothetical protein